MSEAEKTIRRLQEIIRMASLIETYHKIGNVEEDISGEMFRELQNSEETLKYYLDHLLFGQS